VTGLENRIKAQAYGLGFDLVGITRLGPVESAPIFEDWLSKGYAGEMEYLARGAEKRSDTRLPFPGAVSAIVVGMNYGGTAPTGPVARYARGDDYHDVMWRKLDSLLAWIREEVGHDVSGKSYVDTGPILERQLAQQAGLGWIGKNTNLVNPKIGSFFFIGSLLVDLELEADGPFASDRCGSCTACLDACPTGAFAAPRVLDATRCISYLTIESRSEVPDEFRSAVGDLLYGCDICQDVCPWNRFAKPHQEPAFTLNPALQSLTKNDWQELTEDVFRQVFRKSAVKRTGYNGLLRNIKFVEE
jgi:epoxyqueuosine reductase